jgi:small redox-active disulfide protein 2
LKKVQVYGTGCPKCNQLESNARAAVEQLGIEADVVKVTDINQIASAGVMLTPALAIDGEVKVSQKVASVEEIEGWLKG